MDRLITRLNDIPNKYKPVPFWSWNNELDEEELRKQIRYMHENGIGGFFIHARTGLKTPYMGEKWYKCIDACIDEAKKLDMDVWFYDENGWPSGFTGGELLKDEYNLCRFLLQKEEDHFSEEALACFVKKDTYERVTGDVKADVYYNVYEMKDYSNTDILNPVVVDRFIASTHEEYKKRYSQYFGNVVKGFFTDEPQFSRTNVPFTPAAIDLFTEKYGYSPLDCLVYLFNTEEEGFSFRYDYYKLISELYINNFIKRIYDWCESNNLKITGHTIDETTFMGQLMCTMGVMPFYEYEHIPGIDWLGRVVSEDVTPRQVGSVAAQLGRGQVLTETFAMTGWNVTPQQLKHILDFLFLGGANLLCQHLMSYSLKGQGKKDHPPTCGYQIPWKEEFGMLNRYATRLGYLLANTKDITDTLLFHPIRSGYLYCDHQGCGETVEELNNTFNATASKLTQMGIYHHYGDETITEHHGKVVGDTLVIGEMSYKYVVVPKAVTISSYNLNLIREFIKNGGKIYFFSVPTRVDGKECDLSDLHSTVTLEEIKEAQEFEISGEKQGVSFIRKESELGKFLFILNKSCKEKKDVTVKIAASDITILDLEQLKYYSVDYKKDGKYLVFDLHLSPRQSVMFELNRAIEEKEPIRICSSEQDITDSFRMMPSERNIMTLDKAQYSTDGGATFSETYYLFAITEKLLKQKFNGDLVLRQTFRLEEQCNISLLVEEEKYKSFKVNGHPVQFNKNEIDIFALSQDISNYLVVGENVIEYVIDYYNRDDVRHILYDPDIKESLKNCLTFDTELESIYLYGDFEVSAEKIAESENNAVIVKDDFSVRKGTEKQVSPLVENGYPFFSGKMHYAAKLKKSDAARIRVSGDIMAYDVKINGKLVGKGVFEDYVDIGGMLSEEENVVEIIATVSLRNTLGPHHLNVAEPMWVAPSSFTMCGGWDDNKNASYVPDYAMVNSGITKIQLLFI